MTIAPEGLGLQINGVWIGSRGASQVPALEPWVAAVVIYYHTASGDSFVYPLNLDQATQMRDRMLLLSEPKTKPETAGERYKASKEKLGLSFKFDYDEDGIFLADRNASPEGVAPPDVGSISFKTGTLLSVLCIPLNAAECAAFAKVLFEVLTSERHEEPS